MASHQHHIMYGTIIIIIFASHAYLLYLILQVLHAAFCAEPGRSRIYRRGSVPRKAHWKKIPDKEAERNTRRDKGGCHTKCLSGTRLKPTQRLRTRRCKIRGDCTFCRAKRSYRKWGSVECRDVGLRAQGVRQFKDADGVATGDPRTRWE
ncbi:hypothetical protein CALCODRAFT_280387 [Calocera cornea HHB12733]|uniref:Uncharacterized protein n=1 Tax=Calocera cornea HHB12733 TaxID=1353952 RepID=A0A165JSN5_9BASI|nr:hypothetical protein CALCODRAFT_280387 [Calocera cornea HHB12733]